MNIKQASIHVNLIVTHIGLKIGLPKVLILIILFLI